MNPHSPSRFYPPATLRDTPLLPSPPYANARFSRPRTHMTYRSSDHSHPYQDPWNPPAIGPPPVLQKVYILDCNSCGTFLTNRGMRAVLLLQPDVSLYSTDALPVNCSATPGPLEYIPSCESVTCSSSPPSRPPGIPASVPRTCECLTQTLSCHGCGNPIGYMVVIPCNRCTSSVSPTNRHTNRHRFVFFSKEIVASERRYIAHEPGIISYSPVVVSAMTPSSSISSSSSSLHTLDTSSLSTSQFNLANAQHLDERIISFPPTSSSQSPVLTDHSSQNPAAFTAQMNSRYGGFPSFQVVTLKCERAKLRAGDVVYWHHLSRSGEIPAVVEDERARGSYYPIRSPSAGR